MSSDLEAIALLSEQWEERVNNAPRWHSPFGEDILIIRIGDDFLEKEGLKILRLLDDEDLHSSDGETKLQLAVHLSRLGQFYYDGVSPNLLLATDDDLADLEVPLQTIKELAAPHLQVSECAEAACKYAFRAINLLPYFPAPFLLADIFRIAHFYGTALRWYDVVLQIAVEQGYNDEIRRIKARQIDLKADNEIADPPLSRARRMGFPTRNTAGLLLHWQEQSIAPRPTLPTPVTPPAISTSSTSPTHTPGQSPKKGWWPFGKRG